MSFHDSYQSYLAASNIGDLERSSEKFSLLGNDLDGDLCQMSMRTKLVGCALCFGLGMMLSFGAMGRVFALIDGNPMPFVVMYSFGSLIGLIGSMFLSGPAAFVKQMFDKKRILSSIIFITCIISCLGVAFFLPAYPSRSFLLIAICLVQIGAYTANLLSYIPFAQDWVGSFFFNKKPSSIGESFRSSANQRIFGMTSMAL